MTLSRIPLSFPSRASLKAATVYLLAVCLLFQPSLVFVQGVTATPEGTLSVEKQPGSLQRDNTLDGQEGPTIPGNNRYRIWQSEDSEIDPASLDTGEDDDGPIEPEEISSRPTRVIAATTDVSFATTQPRVNLNGSTYFSHQTQAVMDLPPRWPQWIDRTASRSSRIEYGGDFSVQRNPLEAHSLNFLGFIGGAKLAVEDQFGDDDGWYIGRRGYILSRMDYSLTQHTRGYDDYCDEINRNWENHTYEYQYLDGTENHTHLVNATQTCYDFYYSVEETKRTFDMGDWSKNTTEPYMGRRVGYSGVDFSGRDDLTIRGWVNLTLRVHEINREWSPDNRCRRLTDPKYGHTCPPDGVGLEDDRGEPTGSWNVEKPTQSYQPVEEGVVSSSVINRFNESIEREIPVVQTDTNSMTIEQTVINAGPERHHLRIDISGGGTGSSDTFSSALSQHQLWAEMQLEGGGAIRSPWATYTVTNTDNYIEFDQNPRASRSQARTIHQLDRPLLTMRLFPSQKEPSVALQGLPQSGRVPAVVDYEERVLSGGWPNEYIRTDVSLRPTNSRILSQLDVRNAPGPIERIISIHHQEIEVDETTEVPYRQAKLRQKAELDNNRVAFQFAAGNYPLSYRDVYFSGTANSVYQTNRSGWVVVEKTSPYLTAEIKRDTLDNYCDTRIRGGECDYVGGVIIRFSSVSGVPVAEHLMSALVAALLASPLLLLYGYLDRYSFFNP